MKKVKLIMIKETNQILITESKFNLEKEVDRLCEFISLKRAINIETRFEEKFNIGKE